MRDMSVKESRALGLVWLLFMLVELDDPLGGFFLLLYSIGQWLADA